MRKIKINTKTKILIGVLVIAIILIGGWWIWSSQKWILITTDKTEYLSDGLINIKIENRLEDPVYMDPITSVMVESLNEEYKAWTPVRTTSFMPCNCFPEVECDEKGLFSMTEIKPSEPYNLVMVPECFHYSPRSIHYRIRINFYFFVKEEEKYIMKYEYYSNEFVVSTIKKITITTDKTEYKQGETVKITVINNLDDPIFLDGCNPYILEKKEEDRWLPLETMCFIEGLAIKVNAGSKKNFERKLESNYFTGLFRIRVDYNKDCQEGKPLSQSSCKETFTVYSDEFSIKGVSVITDKGVYNQGETIRITLKNNLKESIFSHIGSGTPVFAIEYVERKTPDGNWEKLFAQCQYPHCIYDIDAPAEIKPAQSVTLEWDPWIFIDGTSETVQAGFGRYRLSILYEDYQKTEWMSVYSNEFTIK